MRRTVQALTGLLALGLGASIASSETIYSVDFIEIIEPDGNNLVDGYCVRICCGGTDQFSTQIEANAWSKGPNGIWEDKGGDDLIIPNPTLQYSTDSVDSHSGTGSLSDSPGGSYGDNENSSARITQSFDLSSASSASLRFYHHYNFESGYDYGYVEVRTNNGSWNDIAEYNGGHGGPADYSLVNLNLASFLGSGDVDIRFRVDSDGSVTQDGWHIDDVEVIVDGSTAFEDDFESGTDGWSLNNPWGLESPSSSLGNVDENGVFTSGPVTGVAVVTVSAPGADPVTTSVKVIPPDWVPGP